ncbi:phosphorelay sensor kinase [Aureococcus anophagefferens]|nr:phosphorelay sensor kinase [Aureococcus anophagefferens]
MSIHGSACCLRLITDIQLQHCNTGSREREAACPGTTITKANTWHDGIWAEYTTAIVWSFTAMNGEATFVTHAEGVLGFAMMLVGCILLAFLLGDLANIASNLDPVSNDFKQTLDSINDYMTKLRYPKELRVRLREYVMLSEPVFRFNYYQALLDRLSPGLQAVVAQQNHGAVISNIPFFLYSVHKFYGLAAGSTVRARAPRRKGQPVAWSDRRAVVVRITPDLKYDLEYVDLDPPEMESVIVFGNDPVHPFAVDRCTENDYFGEDICMCLSSTSDEPNPHRVRMFAIEHKEKEKRGHPDRKPSWATRDPLERHVSDGSMLTKRDSHSSNSPEKAASQEKRDSQSEKRDSQSEKRDSQSEKRSRFHFPHCSRTSAASRPRGSSLEEEDVFHEVKGDDDEDA